MKQIGISFERIFRALLKLCLPCFLVIVPNQVICEPDSPRTVEGAVQIEAMGKALLYSLQGELHIKRTLAFGVGYAYWPFGGGIDALVPVYATWAWNFGSKAIFLEGGNTFVIGTQGDSDGPFKNASNHIFSGGLGFRAISQSGVIFKVQGMGLFGSNGSVQTFWNRCTIN